MKKTVVMMTMLFALLAMTLTAQPFQAREDIGKKGFPFFMMEKLNLTEAQKDKIKELHFANEKAEIELEAQVKLAHLEMKEAMSADNIDKDKVLNIHSKINKISGQIKEGKLKTMLEINDLLDDSQKKLWKDHMLMMGRHQMAEKKNWFPKDDRGRNQERMNR